MKKLFLILIASFALLVAHDSNRIHAGEDGGGIPLSNLTGKYAEIFVGGTFTLCFKPDLSGATESCSTPGAIPEADSGVAAGQKTQDKDGNSCTKTTGTFSFPPFVKFPPTVAVFYSVSKVLNYDPATGSGDTSFTNYLKGNCIGSKFDNTGATIAQTGTSHFVASDNGKRVDSIATTFISVVGDIGAFSIPALDLKQE
jgi:hypothetical protein